MFSVITITNISSIVVVVYDIILQILFLLMTILLFCVYCYDPLYDCFRINNMLHLTIYAV